MSHSAGKPGCAGAHPPSMESQVVRNQLLASAAVGGREQARLEHQRVTGSASRRADRSRRGHGDQPRNPEATFGASLRAVSNAVLPKIATG